MPTNPERRSLSFQSLEEVIADVDALLENGYESLGNWNVGQTCFHLGEWARFPMDGFPRPPLPLRAIFGLLSMFGVTEKMKKDILANGFKPGTPTAPQTAAKADAISDSAGRQNLLEVFERMKNYDGEIHPSPLFGDMDRAMWNKVTLLHCDHHLSFLKPKTA